MSHKSISINDHDIIGYLQENQVLLETILYKLQKNSTEEDKKIRESFEEQIKEKFNKVKEIK